MTVSGVANGSVKSTLEASVGSEREPKVRKGVDYQPKESFQEPPMLEAVFTYISYGLLIIMGHIIDFLRRCGLKSSGPGYTEALKKEVSLRAHVYGAYFCGFLVVASWVWHSLLHPCTYIPVVSVGKCMHPEVSITVLMWPEFSSHCAFPSQWLCRLLLFGTLHNAMVVCKSKQLQ